MDTLFSSRAAAATGLAAAGVLHLTWAAGSHWPAPSGPALARAVVGAEVAPDPLPTAVVGTGLLGAALLAARPDRGGPPRWARRAVAVALLVRAAVGGAPAARALGVHEPAETFRTLDRRLYRPFCAVLGTAVAAGSLGGGAS